MDIEKILIIVITAIISGFVGYFFDRIKEFKRNKKEVLAKHEMQHRDRPEFIITDMKDYFNRPGTCITSHKCDLEIFVARISNIKIEDNYLFAKYDDSILDKKSWVCRLYTFKNVGKTVVYGVDIISNIKKNTCIFDVETVDYMSKNGVLNYSELLDKRIAPNESFTLKLCYSKDRIISGTFSAIFEIGMRDDNNTYWVQPFFAPIDKLYESRRKPYKEYREALLTDDAIECFRKPYLW